MKHARLCKFSFDAFVEQRKAAGMITAQTVVYLFYDGSSKPAAPALRRPDASKVPPKLAVWATTQISGDLGFVQHTCSPLSLCVKSEGMAMACHDLLLL